MVPASLERLLIAGSRRAFYDSNSRAGVSFLKLFISV
jgi:hypothetical protein